jgi:hypothetical protein
MMNALRLRGLVLAGLLAAGAALAPAFLPSSWMSSSWIPTGTSGLLTGRSGETARTAEVSPTIRKIPPAVPDTEAETVAETIAGPLALRRGPHGPELMLGDRTILRAADFDASRLRIRATGPTVGPVRLVLVEAIGTATSCARGFHVLDIRADGQWWLSDALGACPDAVLVTPLSDALLIEAGTRSPRGSGPVLYDEAWIYRNGELIPMDR